MCSSTLRRLAEHGRKWQAYSFLPELLVLLIIKIRPNYDYYYYSSTIKNYPQIYSDVHIPHFLIPFEDVFPC